MFTSSKTAAVANAAATQTEVTRYVAITQGATGRCLRQGGQPNVCGLYTEFVDSCVVIFIISNKHVVLIHNSGEIDIQSILNEFQQESKSGLRWCICHTDNPCSEQLAEQRAAELSRFINAPPPGVYKSNGMSAFSINLEGKIEIGIKANLLLNNDYWLRQNINLLNAKFLCFPEEKLLQLDRQYDDGKFLLHPTNDLNKPIDKILTLISKHHEDLKRGFFVMFIEYLFVFDKLISTTQHRIEYFALANNFILALNAQREKALLYKKYKANNPFSALIVAARDGIPDDVSDLTQLCLVDYQEPTSGRTALHQAIIGDKPENVRALLESKADQHIQDFAGRIPKDYIETNTHEKIKSLFGVCEINQQESANCSADFVTCSKTKGFLKVTQGGVARWLKGQTPANVEGLYTDGLQTCVAIIIVAEQGITLIHDTGRLATGAVRKESSLLTRTGGLSTESIWQEFNIRKVKSWAIGYNPKYSNNHLETIRCRYSKYFGAPREVYECPYGFLSINTNGDLDVKNQPVSILLPLDSEKRERVNVLNSVMCVSESPDIQFDGVKHIPAPSLIKPIPEMLLYFCTEEFQSKEFSMSVYRDFSKYCDAYEPIASSLLRKCHVTIASIHPQIVELINLLLNLKTDDIGQAFCLAAGLYTDKEMQLLLDHQIRENTCSIDGFFAESEAYRLGKAAIASLLCVKEKASGNTALHIAIKQKKYGNVLYLVKIAGENLPEMLSIKNAQGKSPADYIYGDSVLQEILKKLMSASPGREVALS